MKFVTFVFCLSVLFFPFTSVALEETPVKIEFGDSSTTVTFSLTECSSSSYRKVRGDVPKGVDLSNDAIARKILQKGGEFAQQKCPKKQPASNVVVALFQGTENQVVRGRNYDDNKFTWSEYTNFPLVERQQREEAAAIAREAKAHDEQRQRELEAKRAQEERYNAEARRRAAQFAEEYTVKEWPSINELSANPFVYEGKVIGIEAQFSTMRSATEGIFGASGGVFVVSNIPKGKFRQDGQVVVLAGRVLGKASVNLPRLGTMEVPHLEFVGVHVCSDDKCTDILYKILKKE